jgi:hypothetical protein
LPLRLPLTLAPTLAPNPSPSPNSNPNPNQVAGPALGGLLVAPPATPSRSGSGSDADSGHALLLQRFPYLLPNLVGAVLASQPQP